VSIAVIAFNFGGRKEVLARAGQLDRPEIAVQPEDRAATALREALLDHKDLFVGGSYINAHSTLNFTGDARKLSRMLEHLCSIEGTAISIRFSQPVVDADCQWSIDHNGWADADRLTVTIFLREGGVHLDELELPTIRGKIPPLSTEKVVRPERDR
jgi:hypothetical protein